MLPSFFSFFKKFKSFTLILLIGSFVVVAIVAVVVAVVVVVVDVSFRLVRVLWLIELFFGGFGTEWNSSGTSEQLNGRP